MYVNNENVLGVPPVIVSLTTADWQKFLGRDTASANLVPLPYPGQVVRAVDPLYGEAEFVLAYGVAGLQIGDAVLLGAAYATTRVVAGSKGLVGVSMSANTDPTALSWFCVRGQVPARMAAAAANAPLYTSGTTGSLANTVTATQGVTAAIGLTALGAAIGTKLVGTTNGSALVAVGNIDGLYIGAAISGTGIPGGATITAIGFGGVMLGAAMPPVGFIQISANCTATAQVTGTFAHGAAFALANLFYPAASNLG